MPMGDRAQVELSSCVQPSPAPGSPSADEKMPEASAPPPPRDPILGSGGAVVAPQPHRQRAPQEHGPWDGASLEHWVQQRSVREVGSPHCTHGTLCPPGTLKDTQANAPSCRTHKRPVRTPAHTPARRGESRPGRAHTRALPGCLVQARVCTRAPAPTPLCTCTLACMALHTHPCTSACSLPRSRSELPRERPAALPHARQPRGAVPERWLIHPALCGVEGGDVAPQIFPLRNHPG